MCPIGSSIGSNGYDPSDVPGTARVVAMGTPGHYVYTNLTEVPPLIPSDVLCFGGAPKSHSSHHTRLYLLACLLQAGLKRMRAQALSAWRQKQYTLPCRRPRVHAARYLEAATLCMACWLWAAARTIKGRTRAHAACPRGPGPAQLPAQVPCGARLGPCACWDCAHRAPAA